MANIDMLEHLNHDLLVPAKGRRRYGSGTHVVLRKVADNPDRVMVVLKLHPVDVRWLGLERGQQWNIYRGRQTVGPVQGFSHADEAEVEQAAEQSREVLVFSPKIDVWRERSPQVRLRYDGWAIWQGRFPRQGVEKALFPSGVKRLPVHDIEQNETSSGSKVLVIHSFLMQHDQGSVSNGSSVSVEYLLRSSCDRISLEPPCFDISDLGIDDEYVPPAVAPEATPSDGLVSDVVRSDGDEASTCLEERGEVREESEPDQCLDR